MNTLHTSLSALSESQLRDVVLRVAAHDPYFCDIIAMELGEPLPHSSDSDNTPPTTPTLASNRPFSRRKTLKRHDSQSTPLSKTFIHFPPTTLQVAAESDAEECCYHPGHLETEDYEFLSLTPEGQAYQVIRTVSMWSCCEGEDKSSGCVVAPAHLFQRRQQQRSATISKSRRRAQTKSKPYDLPMRKCRT